MTPTTSYRPADDDFRPRMIVWHLGVPSSPQAGRPAGEPFTTHECLVTIDSIARLSKPIVILTGGRVVGRPDLYQIVEYGFALGLKIIIEVQPRDLTEQLLAQYARFGPKVFRILLDGNVTEDMDTRFKDSPGFRTLEECVQRVRKAGYELHLGITVGSPSARELAFEHDYAFRRSARGLYCHLCFKDPPPEGQNNDKVLDDFDSAIDGLVQHIAHMKRLGPKDMYLSPQCIKYGLHSGHDGAAGDDHGGFLAGAGGGNGGAAAAEEGQHEEWRYWCLAAKSFAYIDPLGSVQACASLRAPCGDLRSNGYDFRKIWENSYLFQQLRAVTQSCTEVRAFMQYILDHQPAEDKD